MMWIRRNMLRLSACLAVFLVALAVSLTILDAPFWGQDELLVLDRVVKANRAIREENIRALINIFLRDYHPPARTLIAMPFVWLLGPTGLALRLPHCLLWGLVCAFASSLGMKLGGLLAGVATGLLLAVSGLFNVFAMGHGHSGEVLFVLALLLLLVNQKQGGIASAGGIWSYCMGGVLLILGFLFFTSLLPIAALYHLWYFVSSLKPSHFRRRILSRYILASIPFAVFYLFYYLVFLGIPMLLDEAPFGQLQQNMIRSSAAGWNVRSLYENLAALNWYALPWVHIPVLLLGMREMRRRCHFGFWITLPFGLLFCFYIHGMTGAHFFAYFCWIFPFAITKIDAAGSHLRPWTRALFWMFWVVLVGGWSTVGHVRTYTQDSYPYQLLQSVRGHVYWQNNREAPPGPPARRE